MSKIRLSEDELGLDDGESLRQLITSNPSDDPFFQQHLHQLFTLLEERISRSDLGEEANDIIIYLRKAADITEGNDLPSTLGYLGICLCLCLGASGNGADLEEAIVHFRRAITLTPEGHSILPSRLSNLAISLDSRFSRFGEDSDLEEAIVNYRRAITLTPKGHSNLPSRLSNLAISLDSRFSRFGEDSDLEEAIVNYRRAITLTPKGHSNLPLWLNNLANSLKSRFSRFGEESDLEEAIVNYRRAITLTPEGHSNLPTWLNNLAISLDSRFSRFGEDSDLEEAIVNYRQAITLMPEGHSDLPLWLSNLASSLNSRFSRFGEDSDLEEAIVNYQQAIRLTPKGHSNFPSWLNNLALSLWSRFYRFGEDVDLEEAIVNYQQAIRLTPNGHSNLPSWLNNLALSLWSRFYRFGEDVDLEEAIVNYRRAITLAPEGHSNFPGWLNNLANSLDSRFSRFGEDSDLEEAIVNYRRAIALTPEGHSDLPSRLNNLATSLKARFSRFGEDSDLEEAIVNYRQAIALTPEGHSDLPLWLNNLSISLDSRFSRFGEDSDLEEAIINYRRAITLTPESHSNLPTWLNNLAISLTSHFSRFGEDSDLEEAIVNYRRAITLTPEGHSNLPSRLNNLANSLRSRFSRFGEDSDLEEAIVNNRRAIALTSEGHSNLPSQLNNLAISLDSRLSRFGEESDLEETLGLYHRGSTLTTGTIRHKYHCATGLAGLAHPNNRLPVALEGYTTAISLMSQVAWFGQSVASRQRELALQPANFASNAAACAIQLGLLERAVELLDHGRSVFWSQATDSETDLTALRDSDPDLATQFEKVTHALEASTFQDSLLVPQASGEQSSTDNEIERRRLLTKQMESLLGRVRDLPNLHNFMKPPPFSELRLSAAAGPVILLNASSYRCDALIVTADSPPQLVPLPEMSLEDATRIAKDFRGDQGSRDFRSRLEQNLPFVWRAVVLPVLTALGYMATPTNTRSKLRVWWCPTGPFSFIPIHAAGPYTKSGGPDLTRRVLSSYTPTLRALLRARSQYRTSDCRILLIAQPATSRKAPLPSVSDETKLIYEAACSKYDASSVSMLEGHEATKDAVVAKMKDTTCAHFACHGHQEHTGGALQSALFLHDGPLLLSTIASNRLPKADFAFLSACSTATGSDLLPDEAMHIAAGMLIAGFRSVIATMWTINDGTGPRVAEKVYGHLLRSESDEFDSKEAAFALNEGIQSLRKANFPTTDWVPFIHIGI